MKSLLITLLTLLSFAVVAQATCTDTDTSSFPSQSYSSGSTYEADGTYATGDESVGVNDSDYTQWQQED